MDHGNCRVDNTDNWYTHFFARVTSSSVDVWNAVTTAVSWMGLVLFGQFLRTFGTGVIVLALVGYLLERVRLENTI